MGVLRKIKDHYQKPFRNELSNPLLLAIHQITTKLLAIAYKVIHLKKLQKSALLYQEIRAGVEKNEKSVFVFANGPSLSDIDLGKIKVLVDSGEYDLIAINSFLSKSIDKVTPTYAVFADNLHFNSSAVDSQFAHDVKVCTDNSIRFFVPVQHWDEKNILQVGYNAFCNIFCECTSDPMESPGYYGVTAFHALRIAKYLGYKRIYICGFDNSYFKDFALSDDGRLVIRHRHYYDGNESNIEVPSVYTRTSEFFFDTYRHFYYLEKILKDGNFFNIARTTYLNCIPRDIQLSVYK